MISYHKFNEKKQIDLILNHINQGKILALISDAGTPLLSDPGKLLVNQSIKLGIKIVPIPGVSSISAAMSVSGFDDKFLFYGFLPKKENQLNNVLTSLSLLNFCQVFFVPAKKINFYIKKLQKYFSGRKILIAREMTKIHEEFIRMNIDDTNLFESKVKGELTLVVSEKKLKFKEEKKDKIINKAKKYLKKYSLKDTVELILENENLNKKEIYQMCLKIKNEKIN